MILTWWLDQPIWFIFASLAVLYYGASLAFVALTLFRGTRPAMLWLGTGMVPTYFTAVSVLLALLTGFVASDAWERQREANRVVQTERANIRALHDLSIAASADMGGVRKAVAEYLTALVDDEWPRMAVGASSPEASDRLSRLLESVAAASNSAQSGTVTHAALLNAAMALRAARGDRLALSEAHGDETKWLTLLVLSVLTLTAIALVHLDKPGSQASALVIFSTAMVTTLGLIALHERPFDGPLAIGPDHLQTALAARVPATH